MYAVLPLTFGSCSDFCRMLSTRFNRSCNKETETMASPKYKHIMRIWYTFKTTFPWEHWYVHTYIHTYIHTYVHTYIRTYIHTYIHTYIYLVHFLNYLPMRTLIGTYVMHIRTYITIPFLHTLQLIICMLVGRQSSWMFREKSSTAKAKWFRVSCVLTWCTKSARMLYARDLRQGRWSEREVRRNKGWWPAADKC